MNGIDLSGQVALVTGGSRGIGAGVASRLAAAGALVVVNHLEGEDPAELLGGIESAGGRAEARPADVTDVKRGRGSLRGRAEGARSARRARQQRGHREGHAAGDDAGPGLARRPRRQPERRLLLHPPCGARDDAGAPRPDRERSSIQALRSGKGQTNYAAAKAGLLAFTRAAALEVADRGITVNAVLPGFIDTPMTARIKRRGGDRVLEAIPAGRLGRPEDVAGLALPLLRGGELHHRARASSSTAACRSSEVRGEGMRFLLVDRIEEVEPGRRATAWKNAAMSEDYFEWHFPEQPIVPGVLVLEALSQLAGWLEAASSDFERWVLLDRVKTARYYEFARPGDRIDLEVEIVDGDDPERRSYRATSQVAGKRAAVVEFEGKVVPLEDLEGGARARRAFRVLRGGEAFAEDDA
jgi:3-hydroxyacyl-[acyl-carrier-protein] dehydratase